MHTLEVIETADGSITCLDQSTGELYHNRAGAVAEAMHNFVRPLALQHWPTEHLRVLDVPFGLGYNTFVFLQELFRTGKSNDLSNIEIVAIEQDPAVLSLTGRVLQDEKFSLLRESLGLSSGDDFAESDPISASRLRHFCQCLQDSSAYETRVGQTHLSITVRQGDMRKIVPMLADDGQHFDFIMHDPFSPNKMPELWTIDILQRYKQLLPPSGRLTTYSVAVAVRAALLQTGFSLYETAPVGAKSGGTLATASPLKEIETTCTNIADECLQRMQGRSGVPYRDPFFVLSRSEIRKNRIEEQDRFFPLAV